MVVGQPSSCRIARIEAAKVRLQPDPTFPADSSGSRRRRWSIFLRLLCLSVSVVVVYTSLHHSVRIEAPKERRRPGFDPTSLTAVPVAARR